MNSNEPNHPKSNISIIVLAILFTLAFSGIFTLALERLDRLSSLWLIIGFFLIYALLHPVIGRGWILLCLRLNGLMRNLYNISQARNVSHIVSPYLVAAIMVYAVLTVMIVGLIFNIGPWYGVVIVSLIAGVVAAFFPSLWFVDRKNRNPGETWGPWPRDSQILIGSLWPLVCPVHILLTAIAVVFGTLYKRIY